LLNHHHPELEGAEYVVFVDSSRRYRDCSDGVLRLLGCSRAEILEKTIDDISFHAKEVPKLFGLYQRQRKMEGEYILRHKSGMPIPICYRAYIFPDGCNAASWDPIKDWRQLYLSALVEVDKAKLRQRIETALAAVNQEMRGTGESRNRQDQMLRDALSALLALQRDLK
jgi:PAS domain-containing protein